MTRTFAAAAALCLCALTLARAAEQPAAPKPALKTLSEKFSYMMGIQTGRNLSRAKDELDLQALMRGIRDGLEGNAWLLTREEADEVFKKIRERLANKKKGVGEKNLKAAEAFLAENKKKEGVVTTGSGLQYVVLKKGDGAKPKATDRVRVHYRGTLIDGTEFDSSHKRGRPAVFEANRVIAGWTEALQLMTVGSKYRLVIPAKLAYGERGSGAVIGPNAALIFEVELLGIEK